MKKTKLSEAYSRFNSKISETLWIFIFLLFAVNLNATEDDSLKNKTSSNKKWFASISCGYSWPGSNDIIGSEFVNDGQNNLTQSLIRGTFGTGVTNELMIGYMIKPKIGFEIGAFANWGSEVQTKDWAVPSAPQHEEKYIKINSQGFLIGICLTDTFSKIQLSLHNDFILGINYNGFDRAIREEPIDKYETDWKYEGGIGYGWKGKVSLAYNIKPRFNIGIDGFFSLHSWSPTKGTMVRYDVNGVDRLSTISSDNKNLTYSDDVTYSSVSGFPPGIAFKTNYPLHSVGAGFFVTYRF